MAAEWDIGGVKCPAENYSVVQKSEATFTFICVEKSNLLNQNLQFLKNADFHKMTIVIFKTKQPL